MRRLPGVNELQELPLLANVAYAVRSARRVFPCYQHLAKTASQERHVATGDFALTIAEQFCRQPPELGNREWLDLAAGQAAGIAESIEPDDESMPMFSDAADSVAYAIAAASCVRDVYAGVSSDECTARFAFRAAKYSKRVFWDDRPMMIELIESCWADLRGLKHLQLGRYPEPGEPIDPGALGPLGALWRNTVPSTSRFAPLFRRHQTELSFGESSSESREP
jgi:hypothetical protein